MDSDVEISRWVLELLLRDRHKDTIAKRLLAVAPLPDHRDWRLKKSVLLRAIESAIDDALVTETILEALENIEALDRSQGLRTTAAMRVAYCAVATDCTVKFSIFFRRKYQEAVDRIWRGRVRVLEGERSELVSAELKERRNEVEAGIRDRNVSKKLVGMNYRNDALRLVEAYVKEAWASIGPPFLTWAVRFDVAMKNDGNVGYGCGNEVRIANQDELEVHIVNGDGGSGLEGNVGDTKAGDGPEMVTEDNVDSDSAVEEALANGVDLGVGKELKGQRENGASVSDGSGVKVESVNGGNVGGDKCKEEAWRVWSDNNVGAVTVAFPKFGGLLGYYAMDGILKVVGPGRSASNVKSGVLSSEAAAKEREYPRAVAFGHNHRPVKIRDAEYVGMDASDHSERMHNYVPAEVKKLQELKSSVMALRAVVADPHLYDWRVLDIVRSELEVNHVSGEDDRGNLSLVKNTEHDHSNSDTHGNITCSDQNDMPQVSGKEYDAPNSSVDKGKGTVYVRSGEFYAGDRCCGNQKTGPRPGLMECNSTAQTYKWDDSLGMSPEETVNDRLHLLTPRRKAIAQYEDVRFAKRRKV